MIASDICSALLEGETNGGLKEVSKRLRDTVISSNSSLASADLFHQFRGRDPSLASLIELHDLTTQSKLSQS
jgi:Zn-dependent oligopeptidase